MYDDPAHIRKNGLKLSLNDKEIEWIKTRARETGEQPSVLARKLMFMGAGTSEHARDCSLPRSEMRGAHQSLSMA
jgi:hypothetical protein